MTETVMPPEMLANLSVRSDIFTYTPPNSQLHRSQSSLRHSLLRFATLTHLTHLAKFSNLALVSLQRYDGREARELYSKLTVASLLQR